MIFNSNFNFFQISEELIKKAIESIPYPSAEASEKIWRSFPWLLIKAQCVHYDNHYADGMRKANVLKSGALHI